MSIVKTTIVETLNLNEIKLNIVSNLKNLNETIIPLIMSINKDKEDHIKYFDDSNSNVSVMLFQVNETEKHSIRIVPAILGRGRSGFKICTNNLEVHKFIRNLFYVKPEKCKHVSTQ